MQHISADAVTAAAAILAAILSGVTLALTGRRSERRWRREALTEVLVTFLDSSFKGVSKSAVEDRDEGRDISVGEQNAVDSHAEMLKSMTRLRMLASVEVVQQAELLHGVLDKMYDAAYKEAKITDPDKASAAKHKFWDMVVERNSLRNDFVRLARRDLGLVGAAPIKAQGSDDAGPSLRAAIKEVPEMRIHLSSDGSDASGQSSDGRPS